MHLYSGFTDPMATKHFTYSLTFTHSLTFIHPLPQTQTAVSAIHARHHPAHWDGSSLLMDTSTLGQVEPGIKPQTF